jgi:hypothetical protein
MNIDTFIKQGEHGICQDYVLTNNDPENPELVLSDGCSSSPNTEVGSKLIVLNKLIGNHIFENYNEYRSILGDYFCDATLLYLETFGDWISIRIYGDGFVLCKFKNGKIILYNHEYSSNAPYYLSYGLDDDRRLLYMYNFKGSKYITNKYTFKESLVTVEKNEYGNVHIPTYCYLKDEIETIIIGSDGMNSFKTGNDILPLQDICVKMLDFKNYNGSFLKRRMNKLIKELNVEGYTNFDDVSLAALTTKE